jgi:hypothetical protein
MKTSWTLAITGLVLILSMDPKVGGNDATA